MKTTPITFDDLSSSVLAVPPLARHDDLTVNPDANALLIRHLEAGGVTTLLYGGNANFYNVALSEYERILESLIDAAADDSWLLPSVGPAYGTMMDQAEIVRDLGFPTAMVLPATLAATPEGVETGLRRFAERFGKPIVLYLKFEGYLNVDGVRRLVDDGLVSCIKYAVVRENPSVDAFLSELSESIDRRYMISGIGERPAIAHVRDFELPAFTSGSVCLAPRASTRLLHALRDGEIDEAARIRERFLPLEDLRDAINPIRVLHDAVTAADIADMGPILPLTSNLEPHHRERVAAAARELAAYDRTL